MSDAITVRVLTTLLSGLSGQDKLVIRRETLDPCFGPAPSIAITGAHAGFDWDHGYVFLSTESPVQAAGEALKAEQKAMSEFQDMLAKISFITRQSTMTSDEKIAAITDLFSLRREKMKNRP